MYKYYTIPLTSTVPPTNTSFETNNLLEEMISSLFGTCVQPQQKTQQKQTKEYSHLTGLTEMESLNKKSEVMRQAERAALEDAKYYASQAELYEKQSAEHKKSLEDFCSKFNQMFPNSPIDTSMPVNTLKHAHNVYSNAVAFQSSLKPAQAPQTHQAPQQVPRTVQTPMQEFADYWKKSMVAPNTNSFNEPKSCTIDFSLDGRSKTAQEKQCQKEEQCQNKTQCQKSFENSLNNTMTQVMKELQKQFNVSSEEAEKICKKDMNGVCSVDDMPVLVKVDSPKDKLEYSSDEEEFVVESLTA